MDLQTLHIIHDRDNIHRFNRLKDELNKQGIENYYLWDAIHDIKTTYRGINKAHKQIIHWAAENNLPYVTIMEDDAQFFDKGAYQYFLDVEPKEYDIWLGGIFLGELDEYNMVNRFTGLSLYRTNKKYFNTFLRTQENEHLDIALSDIGGDFIVCNPMVIRQHNGYSTNEKRWMNYDFMFSERQIFVNKI